VHVEGGVDRLHGIDSVKTASSPVYLIGSRVEHYVGCSDCDWSVLAKDNWGGLIWLNRVVLDW